MDKELDMKKDKKLLECLFGHHSYDSELTIDKGGVPSYRCGVCGRSAYYINLLGEKVYRKYDENGKCIHKRWSDGEERWYDDEGDCIRVRYSDGTGWRFDDENCTRT